MPSTRNSTTASGPQQAPTSSPATGEKPRCWAAVYPMAAPRPGISRGKWSISAFVFPDRLDP